MLTSHINLWYSTAIGSWRKCHIRGDLVPPLHSDMQMSEALAPVCLPKPGRGISERKRLTATEAKYGGFFFDDLRPVFYDVVTGDLVWCRQGSTMGQMG